MTKRQVRIIGRTIWMLRRECTMDNIVTACEEVSRITDCAVGDAEAFVIGRLVRGSQNRWTV